LAIPYFQIITFYYTEDSLLLNIRSFKENLCDKEEFFHNFEAGENIIKDF